MAIISNCFAALLAAAAHLAAAVDLSSYVLPLTGTEAGGNIFPGVSAPFGMVKLGPDMDRGANSVSSYSGYQPGDAYFTGFSMLHESGTGGAPKYGVVSQMPVVGGFPANPLQRIADQRASGSADSASPGAYQAHLASGIVVDLAADTRAGLLQYTFPANAEAASVVVDVSHVLPAPDRASLSQHALGGNISLVQQSDSIFRYTGAGTYDNGWNEAPAWNVFFCGYVAGPHGSSGSAQTFVGTGTALRAYPAGTSVASASPSERVGAVFQFPIANDNDGIASPAVVTSRVGVSFRSADQACRNVDAQVPEGTTHGALAGRTRTAWNNDVLGRVTTKDTGHTARLQLLYTSLYHMLLLPQNKTGENPGWTSSEPYYDDVFTLWDLFRCTTSLVHILQPTMYTEFLRSLVDIWRHDGFLPDARSSFFNGATQGGSNADNVLADAYVKGVTAPGLLWDDAYAAMKTNAETVPPNNKDTRDPSGSTKEGRGALPDWLAHGFITRTYGRSVSRAVEYSVNDFGLYQVASGLGKSADAQKYLSRSRNWRNHWNPDASALGFKGFLVPRTTKGFINQDPLSCGGCYWRDDYYEALPWEYSFNAHHDLSKLITLAGGRSTFEGRLNMTFEPGKRPQGSEPFGNTIFNPGNEPSFTTPYLFHYVGRPELSVQHSRAVADTYYHATPSGLPGNSDAGAMESWLLWSMIGLYPMTGQTTFLIGSPWFNDLTIQLGGGTLTITAKKSSDTDIHVQNLKVNGQAWHQNWLTYNDIFAHGGSLAFVLGPEPSKWSAAGPLPPSPAS